MPTSDEIRPIPEVPERLRTAAQIGKLIPFIGAGVSRLAGCPDWDHFADSTLAALIDSGEFSYAQLDQVKNLNARVKLSIAISLKEKANIPINFRDLLHQVPLDKHEDGRRIYSYLSKLGRTFVTTNYDTWLDKEILYPSPPLTEPRTDPAPKHRKIYYRPEELTVSNLNEDDVVIHLHGTVTDPASMIMTTSDYVRHYANDRRVSDRDPENYVLTFLQHLFQQKTVLFVGYGMTELEILEYMIAKAGTKDKPLGHFLLEGFFSHQKELMMSMRTYYAECGIQLLPFLIDDKGWRQLIHVLEEFSKTAPASKLSISQHFKEMEALLDG